MEKENKLPRKKGEDYIELKPAPAHKSFIINDGKKETRYVLKRWRYGDELEAQSKCARVTRRGMDTDFDTGEYQLLMMEATIKKPKMTRQKLLDLDPRVGRKLFRECTMLNNPDVDFQDILAKLQESP